MADTLNGKFWLPGLQPMEKAVKKVNTPSVIIREKFIPLPEYYNQRHSSALNKISGRLTEGKEFIFAYKLESFVPINAGKAYTNRWYGNASERKCNELTRHFYMLLNDPY